MNEGRILDQFVSREIDVNSFHHQAVDEVGDRIIVEGISNDGIIECISVEGVPAYGFQWHPSFCPNYWVSERILELFKPW